MTTSLPVFFRPTSILHQIPVDAETTVEQILRNVCKIENFYYPENCFFWYKTSQILLEIQLKSVELFPVPSFSTDFPEIRLKFVQQLIASEHISKHVFLSSPEQIDYHELLSIGNPHRPDDVQPAILTDLVEEIRRNRRSSRFPWFSISLPVFSRKSIDFLPTILIELPEILHRDEWKAFVSLVTTDLGLKEGDLIVVNIRRETKSIELKLTTSVVGEKKSLLKFNRKTMLNNLKLTKRFFDIQYARSKGKLTLDLTNFDVDFSQLEQRTKISPIFVDFALQLSERLAVIDESIEEFLVSKTRLITTCLFNSLEKSPAEFVIDHINFLYQNESSREKTLKNEQILFYATAALRLDEIWQNFPFFSSNQIGEDGPLGRGFYLTSSPRQTIERVEQIPHATIYLLAAIVELGETFEVDETMKNFDEIPPDFHSVRVPNDDEFLIKSAEQILPLYLVGLRRIDRFVIWRDAKITNDDNADLYRRLRQYFDFNIYGCQSNIEVFEMLKKKFVDSSMKSVVITNGADDAENFIRECRKLRIDLPMIVFCFNVKHHEQWAKKIPSPKVKVTDKVEDLIVFIEKVFAN